MFLCRPSFFDAFLPAASFGFACLLSFGGGMLKKLLVHHYYGFHGMEVIVASSTFGVVRVCGAANWVGLHDFADLCEDTFASLPNFSLYRRDGILCRFY